MNVYDCLGHEKWLSLLYATGNIDDIVELLENITS